MLRIQKIVLKILVRISLKIVLKLLLLKILVRISLKIVLKLLLLKILTVKFYNTVFFVL